MRHFCFCSVCVESEGNQDHTFGTHHWHGELLTDPRPQQQARSTDRPPTPLLNHLCAGRSQSHKNGSAVDVWSEHWPNDSAPHKTCKMGFVCQEKSWLSSLPHNSQCQKRTFSSLLSQASNRWKKALAGSQAGPANTPSSHLNKIPYNGQDSPSHFAVFSEPRETALAV